MKRHEFWIVDGENIFTARDNQLDAEKLAKFYDGKTDVYYVREVLPGEDDIVKMLVEALDELADIVQGHLQEGNQLDSFTLQPAEVALAKYKAWVEKNK